MSFEIEKDWITKAGLRAVCAVMLHDGRKWHRCGYVQVPVGHQLYGVGYGEPTSAIPNQDNAKLGKKSPILAITAGVNAEEGETIRRSPDVAFDCHGGLTFSGGSGKYPVESDGWWFGFDCGHSGDAEIEPNPDRSWGRDGVVRSQDYVESECESLAEQIVAMFPEMESAHA